MHRLGAVLLIGISMTLWVTGRPTEAILPLGVLIAINGQDWTRKP